jgi:hypothetical protein
MSGRLAICQPQSVATCETNTSASATLLLKTVRTFRFDGFSVVTSYGYVVISLSRGFQDVVYFVTFEILMAVA